MAIHLKIPWPRSPVQPIVRPLSVVPVPRLSRRVGDRHNLDFIFDTTKNDLKRKTTHQIETVPFIAMRKPSRVIPDCEERPIKFRIVVSRCLHTTLRVPAKRFSELPLRARINDNPVTQVQQPCVLVVSLLPNRIQSPRRNQRRRYGGSPRQPRRRPEQPNPWGRWCPTTKQ